MKYNKIIIAGMIFCCLGIAIFYHFRKDIFTIPTEYYVLESDTSNVGKSSRHLIVLLSNVPCLEKNVKKCLEESFWRHMTLDTLHSYNIYSVRFYQETKYLTSKFKEGNQYVPLYSHWDNTMDWRNHNEDRLGIVSFIKRKNGTVFYSTTTYDAGYGFRMLVNTSKEENCVENYESSTDFYIKKCKELGLEKTDIENDEKY